MSCKFVVLAGLELGQELLDVLLNLGEFRDGRLSVHHRVISRYADFRNLDLKPSAKKEATVISRTRKLSAAPRCDWFWIGSGEDGVVCDDVGPGESAKTAL